MASYTKLLHINASSDGDGLKVAATASAGTTFHTAVSGTDDIDEVWAWAWNSSSSDVLLTLELGGTGDPDNIMEVTIPSQQGLYQIIPGLPFQNGAVLAAFAANNANVIVIYGYVNRIA